MNLATNTQGPMRLVSALHGREMPCRRKATRGSSMFAAARSSIGADESTATIRQGLLPKARSRARVVATEFDGVGRDIRTTEFSIVFSTLESVIPKQEGLAQEVRGIDSPSNLTALAQTLFTDAYELELEGYRMLNRVAGQAQANYPESTARRLRRLDGYAAAVNRLDKAERSRARAFEELEELLGRVGTSLEEVREPGAP